MYRARRDLVSIVNRTIALGVSALVTILMLTSYKVDAQTDKSMSPLPSNPATSNLSKSECADLGCQVVWQRNVTKWTCASRFSCHCTTEDGFHTQCIDEKEEKMDALKDGSSDGDTASTPGSSDRATNENPSELMSPTTGSPGTAYLTPSECDRAGCNVVFNSECSTKSLCDCQRSDGPWRKCIDEEDKAIDALKEDSDKETGSGVVGDRAMLSPGKLDADLDADMGVELPTPDRIQLDPESKPVSPNTTPKTPDANETVTKARIKIDRATSPGTVKGISQDPGVSKKTDTPTARAKAPATSAPGNNRAVQQPKRKPESLERAARPEAPSSDAKIDKPKAADIKTKAQAPKTDSKVSPEPSTQSVQPGKQRLDQGQMSITGPDI